MTAVIEAGAGLALICFASAAAALLLGSPLDTAAAVTIARLAGVALVTLGMACWLVRGEGQGRAARGLVAAMALYNIGAVALLAFAGIGPGLVGIALWPAVLLHAAMAAWCLASLRRRAPGKPIETSSLT